MYPYEIFLGMDLYSIFIAVGVILCMVFIRLQSDWRGLRAKLQNLFLFLFFHFRIIVHDAPSCVFS